MAKDRTRHVRLRGDAYTSRLYRRVGYDALAVARLMCKMADDIAAVGGVYQYLRAHSRPAEPARGESER